MEKAVALANNDVVLLAWSYEKEIPNCLGFAIYRLEANGARTLLPAWIGFKGESNPDWKPKDTAVWPIQKYSWRDLTATRGQTCRYEIVPRVGEPDDLSSAEDRSLRTNAVTLTPVCSDNVRAYFNRGILSTQALAHALPKDADGAPSETDLHDHIVEVGDPIRLALAGQIIDGLTLLLKAAVKDDGKVHGALYELNDPELVKLLEDPEHISLVLSNAGQSDDPDAINEEARASLHGAGVDVTDRMMSSGHIGHNKFLIKQGPDGTPLTVLSGSTNWTYTGLCAQANNTILITDKHLAETYRDYWEDLRRECPDPPEKATQDDDFRKGNDARRKFEVDEADITLWFSPNTERHTKPDDPPAPSDMAEVFERIEAAEQGVLFLLFQPGSPNILEAVLSAQAKKPDLFVRGAATDPDAIKKYEALLYHRTGKKPEVAAAAAVESPIGSMQKELLKSSRTAHAIIHDKIVVIDPKSSDCTVITGSHNLGYRASYNNDENMLIVEGHQRLAQAYATHVMDIYDHYRWRWRVHEWEKARRGPAPDEADQDGGGGLATDPGWQAKYFTDPEARAERLFWL